MRSGPRSTATYSNADGRYEFPKLEPGTYTLRIARPREFHPFVKEKLEINGPAELADITLVRVTNAALLPALPEIAAQMTGSEWLLSLSGTGEEKRLLTVNYNWCHSHQQTFRDHYVVHGSIQIINQMPKGP